jgi:5-methyltetrahydrofolate--homocysteine methyltransferase
VKAIIITVDVFASLMGTSLLYDNLAPVSALKSVDIPSPLPGRAANSLRLALAHRTVVADGAMGTMIQAANPSLADFEGHEGCNEVLNRTRPDLIAQIHSQYFDSGVDAVETNTFGANFANLSEYGIEDQIYELSLLGARVARDVADRVGKSTDKERWVLGSIGPGTKLPTLGHISYEHLRDTYEKNALGLIDGGADGIIVETTQDLLQLKAAVNGARAAIRSAERDVVLIAQITVEATGTMLLGSETLAALNVLSSLNVDVIGMNCATGPAEMSEHLRQLSITSNVPLSCMPNAGLPVLGGDGPRYDLGPEELASSLRRFAEQYGVKLLGGCCGTTPEHLKAVVGALDGLAIEQREISEDAGASSIYQFVPFRQDRTYLSIGERTNANGSRAFRDALLAEDWQACLEIAKDQVSEGAHMIDLSVDYVGRDGAQDMSELASRFATAITLPIVLDSTEPNVLKAGLERLGGRCVINSVNYEDGNGEGSRFAKIMPLVKEHGAAVIGLTIDEDGQARDADWKVRVAERLITELTSEWRMSTSEIMIDCLTFPIATGQEETRKDGIATLDAIKALKERYPDLQMVLGVSNVSFGLNPAARVVLNSVFLHEAVAAGLTAAIVHPSKIEPLHRIDDRAREVALDLVYDRRRFDGDTCTYDPLVEFLQLFEGVELVSNRVSKLERLYQLPLEERLKSRIIDGERTRLDEDLQLAMSSGIAPLSIINDHLLEGMKTVGELFGKGEMQLPFVLQSAEVMKSAVAYLEPFMERSEASDRGSILLATVKGDVHDIGKNLVDIILSNNGYRTVNIGIKQTINQIIDAAESSSVDVIGMSGLLVKSTVIMRENLQELTTRGLATKWPIILGGAALTRSYVEQDLADEFSGVVRYARDAFEGLDLMNTLMAIKQGDASAALPPLKRRVTPRARTKDGASFESRSDVSRNVSVPKAPFLGSRTVKGISVTDYLALLDERALFVGQWGLDGSRGRFEEMAVTEGRPRLRSLLNEAQSEKWLEAGVVYGYFPCYSEDNDLVIVDHENLSSGRERMRFSFPRQSRDRHLCISDFFRDRDESEAKGFDVVAFHIVTMGNAVSKATSKLFEENRYREYLELHGMSVQLTEALAEYWHKRVREELSIVKDDSSDVQSILDQGYRGSRYSFGYPACPDLSQQTLIMELLDAQSIGVSLSEEFQLHPEQSTSAIIVHHPEAKYFNAN